MDRTDILDRLRADHDRLRALVATLRGLIALPGPCDMAELSALRWELGRTTMQHLAVEDRHVYRPLKHDLRPGVASLQAAFEADLVAFFDDYVAHAQHWTPDRVIVDWRGYGRTVSPLLARLINRMTREERQLYPLVGAGFDPGVPLSVEHNWVKHAFAIKDHVTRGVGL